jgi:serine/threonine protein kinase
MKEDEKKLVLKKVSSQHKDKDIDFAKEFKNHDFASVVKIYDYFDEGTDFYIVMELCTNGSLSEFIHQHMGGKAPIEESVIFLR